MARFSSLALLASLALVCLGQLQGVAAGCVDNMEADKASFGNFHGKGRELSQCVREYRQKYGRQFKCGNGFRGKTCVQIKNHFESFLSDLRLCLTGPTPTTASPTTTPPPKPMDCREWFDNGGTGDQVTLIYPDGENPVSVRCINSSTVILNRDSFAIGFIKSFAEYAAGFGNQSGDYYLGNEVLHTLTSAKSYKLRVDIVRPNNIQQLAEYTTFQVGPAGDLYRLNVSGYSGTAGDALEISNGDVFSAFDNGNPYGVGLATAYGGGFWFDPSTADPPALVTSSPDSLAPRFVWGTDGQGDIKSVRMSLER